ncbi:Cation/calcium exchanger 1 [Sesamum angolense]|uniref:Cation/calcium exchanger 1 n=1 Tax=Sesamum angolense TaxID=2727404 RepID=A0AAE2BP53_9LAMI|nr:Cation/calcium exchanger 1 [Sesamum angolense]
MADQFFSKYPYAIILLNLSFIFLISCLLTAHFRTHPNPTTDHYKTADIDSGCKGIQMLETRQEKCSYVKSHEGCKPRGYIPYLHLFYCTFSPVLGYLSLSLWLILLFYLLADTASNYFCHSLVGLSKILKLSPTAAGISLLSLGNGAPDVFASIISFTGDGTADIGLNSVLGGALFVSCVVVGIIGVSVGNDGARVSRRGFIINVGVLLLSLACLILIIAVGELSLWAALSFLSLYFIYALLVFACSEEKENENGLHDVEAPLCCYMDNEGRDGADTAGRLPNDGNKGGVVSKMLCILELPLYLPRRLTIPLVSEDKWSKPFAVSSVTLAPIALVLTWNSDSTKLRALEIGGSVGIVCGILAFCTIQSSNPPRKCLLFCWLRDESLLGLTVLAWGNSVGDLVANVTMAQKGGPEGAQIAISGSYAGPIFNTVVGLGLSLSFSAWTTFPASYAMFVHPSVFVTIGFFMVGLIWAFVMLTKRKMAVDKSRDGDLQEAKALLEYNPRLVRYSTFGVRNSPCIILQLKVVSLLLESGVDINLRNYRGQTALMQACQYGHWEVVQILMLLKANYRLSEWRTALHLAALNGHARCIRLLLADHIPSIPNVSSILRKKLKNDESVSAFDWRALAEIVNGTADGGVTALHMAALNGHAETVHLLLDLGASVSATTVDDGTTFDLIGAGSTPLHYAACGGNAQCCQLLIAKGASLTIENSNGDCLEDILSQQEGSQRRLSPSPYLCLPLKSIVDIARECGWGADDPSSACFDPCVVCLERKCTVAAEGILQYFILALHDIDYSHELIHLVLMRRILSNAIDVYMQVVAMSSALIVLYIYARQTARR